MTKTISITQSNYIPWKGYFDLIRACDEVILYDSVQFTKRDWRSRNLIKTPSGPRWLTIPVESRGRFHQNIDESRVASRDWAEVHWRSIELNYARAGSFETLGPWFRELILSVAEEPMLTTINEKLLRAVCERLGIVTPVMRCTDILDRDSMNAMGPTDRLVSLCQAAGATRYLSGPSAKEYLVTDRFRDQGIDVVWMDYDGYPAYPQLWGPFIHHVSIVDLLLNAGDAASTYLKPV